MCRAQAPSHGFSPDNTRRPKLRTGSTQCGEATTVCLLWHSPHHPQGSRLLPSLPVLLSLRPAPGHLCSLCQGLVLCNRLCGAAAGSALRPLRNSGP
jgi:hypothetical protein